MTHLCATAPSNIAQLSIADTASTRGIPLPVPPTSALRVSSPAGVKWRANTSARHCARRPSFSSSNQQQGAQGWIGGRSRPSPHLSRPSPTSSRSHPLLVQIQRRLPSTPSSFKPQQQQHKKEQGQQQAQQRKRAALTTRATLPASLIWKGGEGPELDLKWILTPRLQRGRRLEVLSTRHRLQKGLQKQCTATAKRESVVEATRHW